LLSATPGQLAPAGADPQSSFETAITVDGYWYLGYALPDEEAGMVFVKAYREFFEETGKPPIDDRIEARTHDGGDGGWIDRLRGQWHERESGSPIPVFIERPGHLRGGSNVLFLDGHVEFMKYPGPWPMTEKFIKALESLDALKVKE